MRHSPTFSLTSKCSIIDIVSIRSLTIWLDVDLRGLTLPPLSIVAPRICVDPTITTWKSVSKSMAVIMLNSLSTKPGKGRHQEGCLVMIPDTLHQSLANQEADFALLSSRHCSETTLQSSLDPVGRCLDPTLQSSRGPVGRIRPDLCSRRWRGSLPWPCRRDL